MVGVGGGYVSGGGGYRCSDRDVWVALAYPGEPFGGEQRFCVGVFDGPASSGGVRGGGPFFGERAVGLVQGGACGFEFADPGGCVGLGG